jgi:uncharacterized BrkB/YihY/UPF0761 family membrane protein
MWMNLTDKNRKRLYLIIFFVLPVCFAISIFVLAKIFYILNIPFETKELILAIVSLVPLYLFCILVVQYRLSKKGKKVVR